MRALVTAAQMKEIDRMTIAEIGIPSLVLMERAALCVAAEVKKRAGRKDRILCVCGPGNNGADGIAVGRILHLEGYQVELLLCGKTENASDDFRIQKQIAQNTGLPAADLDGLKARKDRFDVVVDAVFGVGLDREIKGSYLDVFAWIKQLKPDFCIAVDMPSGICSDSGQIMGGALKADVTVTFGWEKIGTMLYPGREYAGRVLVSDIGFPAAGPKQAGAAAFAFTKADLKMIPARPPYSNKGSFGKVLLVAGAKNMGGAAYFSALAAYKTGAGLVKIMTVEENRGFLQSQLPEALLETFAAGETGIDSYAMEKKVEDACLWADAVVVGPGLGQADYAKLFVEMILARACCPVIIDADGLNIIAANPYLTDYYTENIVITPHLGEMTRLTGKTISAIQHSLIATAVDYARQYGVTCVLKDAATITAFPDGRCFINHSGNPAMAKGGSGDVLTGVIAGLLAQGMEMAEAAALGVYLHGLAGDYGRKKYGAYGLLARDIAFSVGAILNMEDQRDGAGQSFCQ